MAEMLPAGDAHWSEHPDSEPTADDTGRCDVLSAASIPAAVGGYWDYALEGRGALGEFIQHGPPLALVTYGPEPYAVLRTGDLAAADSIDFHLL